MVSRAEWHFRIISFNYLQRVYSQVFIFFD